MLHSTNRLFSAFYVTNISYIYNDLFIKTLCKKTFFISYITLLLLIYLLYLLTNCTIIFIFREDFFFRESKTGMMTELDCTCEIKDNSTKTIKGIKGGWVGALWYWQYRLREWLTVSTHYQIVK